MRLGFDKQNKEQCCQYVPIIKTIEALLKDTSVKRQFNNPPVSQDGIWQDINDGDLIKGNLFFIKFPNAIKVLLFQDAFEVVNPLGSAKKKHKVLAMYATLGNIHPENRSKIHPFQLVLLVREIDLKYFGQNIVFRALVYDLKKLEEVGVLVDDQYVQGTLAMIMGDNLGSHGIGGFVENFSSCSHVCRFCLILLEQVRTDATLNFYCERTPDNYTEACAIVQGNPELGHYKGVKFNSIFNELQYYHVCNPGLPPCLGHDLFEGVVQYDLALFLNCLIKIKKWFSYTYLNQLIVRFKYKGYDANDKPSIVNENGKTLGGHAVQNWCLLRLLPLLISSKIQDHCDEVWAAICLLREIVENFSCASCLFKSENRRVSRGTY